MKIVPNEEFITKNYTKTIELLEKLNLPELKKLVENYSEEYATAPASTYKKMYSAFPGGLCYHNLNVLKWLNTFANEVAPNEWSKSTLLKIAILHDFGKVGEKDNPYFVPNPSEWHRNNGFHYDMNDSLKFFMRVPHRSLFLAQQFGIHLTEDEYLAILLCDGQWDEANAPYKYKETRLAYVTNMAVQWARKVEGSRHEDIAWP